MSAPLIQFRGVHKRFGSEVVLDGLDLTIHEGLVTTIIGRSGVGKSVLLKHVIGLLEPDAGEILYRDRNLTDLSRRQRRRMKHEFSYMFQNSALFDSMTVWENIALPLQENTGMSKHAVETKVQEKIEQLELREFPGKYPAQLSGGMRKRVALARALITEPAVILFDEPTTGLDPIRKNAVHGMISQYQQQFGFTAVVVSHDIPDVFDISQRIAMLERGKIHFQGGPDDILGCTDPVVQAFLEGRGDDIQPAAQAAG